MAGEEIARQDFTVSLRGYDREEVDAYLEQLAGEMAELRRRAGQLPATAARDGPRGDPKDLYRKVGEETSRILLAAEEAAGQIRERAEKEVSALLADARRRSEEIVRGAHEERRGFQQEIQQLQEARNTLATQLEDVGRRLQEMTARLKTPIEAPPMRAGPAAPAAPAEAAQLRKPPEARPAPAPKVAEKDAAAPAAPAEPAARAEPAPEPADAVDLERLLGEIRQEREEGRRQVEAALEVLAEPEDAPAPGGAAPAVTAPPDAALVKRQSALGDSPERAARRLKRLLQEDQNFILDRLRQHKGKGSFDESISPHDEQSARFRDGLGNLLEEAFDAGHRAAGAAAPVDAGKGVSDLISKQLVNPLRKDLARIVDAGFAAGDTSRAIAERASDVFRVWKGVRTELLGEGLVFAAFHRGLVGAWREAGTPAKRWVFSTDEDDCPKNICQSNTAAGAVALNDPFPSGHLVPPAHGGCDCTLSEG